MGVDVVVVENVMVSVSVLTVVEYVVKDVKDMV